MRIVQLANFYTPTSGGLRTCLEELGRGYLAHGHERTLIVPGERDVDEWTPAGRRLYLASPRMPAAHGYRHLVARDRVRQLLAQARPDILEVSDKLSIPWLARWARDHGVPIVLFSHERIDAMLRPRLPRWVPLVAMADLINRRLSRAVDAVVVASAFAADEFHRVGAANVNRIALGVDLATFHPDAGHRPRTDGVIRLVTVSRLSKEKSPEQSIECLRLLRADGLNAELVLIGDGPLRTELARQGAGLPIRFIGHVADRNTLAGLIADADIALAPCGTETFGLAILEALACGTPVIVSHRGAAHELIQDGAGIVAVGTVGGRAGAVRRLCDNPATGRRSAARQVAERYPWSATVTSMLAAHELQLSARRSDAGAG